jgi:hypothetical protein
MNCKHIKIIYHPKNLAAFITNTRMSNDALKDSLTSGAANQSLGPTIRLTGEVITAKLYSGGFVFPYFIKFLRNP